jgi:hypothetical protein
VDRCRVGGCFDRGQDDDRNGQPERQPQERRPGQGDLPVRRVRERFIVAGAGAALIMAMAKLDYFWIANVIYLGFVLWAVAGSVVKLVAYRRGL